MIMISFLLGWIIAILNVLLIKHVFTCKQPKNNQPHSCVNIPVLGLKKPQITIIPGKSQEELAVTEIIRANDEAGKDTPFDQI